MAMILITDTPQGGACRCEGQELDLASLSTEQVEALKQALGISETAGAGQVDFSALSPEQVEALKQALGPSELDIPSLTRKILSEQINMGAVFDNWNTRFEAMNSVQVDGFVASSSAGLADYIELLAKAVNRLVERVDRLEAGQ